jgi:hypothetical protein
VVSSFANIMSKNLYKIIFVASVFFSALLLVPTKSIAEICHTTADGKVIIENNGTSATLPADETPLSDDGGTSFSADACLVSPLFYRMEGYEILLCTSDPYVSASTPNFTNCPSSIVSRANTNPKIIEIPLGEEVDMLDGETLVIPIGIYSHAVFIGGNHLAVKHNVDFVKNSNNAEGFIMDGYNTVGAGPQTGIKCWTVKDAATTYNNLAASSHTSAEGITRAYTSPTPGEEESLGLTCGTSIVTTEGDTQEYGYQFEIIDSMGGEGAFKAHDDYSDDPYAEGTSRAFVLLQSNGEIATTRANANKIAYIAQLPDQLNITELTNGFKILIATNSTVSLDVHRSDAGPQTLEAIKMGVEPFGVKFQVRSRKTETFSE